MDGIQLETMQCHMREALASGLNSLMHTPREQFNANYEGAPEKVLPQRRALSKTPCITGISLLQEFFPSAKVLVILRNPRDVIESEMIAFGTEYTRLVLAWRKAARILLDFMSTNKPGGQYKIVRYEDLYRKPKETVTDILHFLGLNVDRYNLDDTTKAPIIGASAALARGEWSMDYNYDGFDPVGKWKHWHNHRIEFFEKTAGVEATTLGYALQAKTEIR